MRVLFQPLIFAGTLLIASGTLHGEEVPAQHLEITGRHTLHLTYDCSFTWPSGSAEEAVFYLPIPQNTGDQRIEHFSSNLHGTAESDGANPPHRYLTATLHHRRGDAGRVHWRVDITGQFETRQLVDGPPDPGKVIVAPAPGEFLDSTESINWDGDAFQAWLDDSGLRRRTGESAVEFGSRVYAYFQTHGRYTYPPQGAWNAAAASRRLRTDCGGFSLVFTAACRANHIPARLLVGQCFKGRQESDGSVALVEGRQAHVIAEFFDPQIGWIPEDITSMFLRAPGYADLNFFGRDPGYFFAWHVDTDFHFHTPRKADTKVQWIQNPSLWFSENADAASETLSHHWTINALD